MDREVALLEQVRKVREAEGVCARLPLLDSHGDNVTAEIEAIFFFLFSALFVLSLVLLSPDFGGDEVVLCVCLFALSTQFQRSFWECDRL